LTGIVVALLLFGGEKIPELLKGMRKGLDDLSSVFRSGPPTAGA
jgi:Sec-independent protein translocase protein TatA